MIGINATPTCAASSRQLLKADATIQAHSNGQLMMYSAHCMLLVAMAGPCGERATATPMRMRLCFSQAMIPHEKIKKSPFGELVQYAQPWTDVLKRPLDRGLCDLLSRLLAYNPGARPACTARGSHANVCMHTHALSRLGSPSRVHSA